MNGSNLTPPASTSLGPPPSSSTLKPSSSSTSSTMAAPSSGSATGNPRNKVALRPGRSLMDWVRLGHSGVDLTGMGGKLVDVTPQQLSKHNKPKDCWMALKGKVYNVTSYLEFHPGGEDELMRGAGIDATTLFNEVHKWVNFETMLQKCLVGQLVEARPFFLKPALLSRPKTPKTSNNNKPDSAATKNSMVVPSLGPPVSVPTSTSDSTTAGLGSTPKPSAAPPWPSAPTPLPTPKYDWFQTNNRITVVIYTRWSDITPGDVVVIKKNDVVKVVCYIQDMCYTVHLNVARPLTKECTVRGGRAGKVEVVLGKEQVGQRWSGLGKTLDGHGEYIKTRDKETEYVECRLVRKEQVTHDSRLYVVEVPPPSLIPVPVGYHVYIRIPGKEDVVKPYTPVAPALKVTPKENEQEEGRYIHLYIKVYPDGVLTPLLDEIEVGSGLEVSLPEGTFTRDRLTAATSTAYILVLLAAGTGITPMLKLLLQALANSKNVHLVLFNKTEEDIPWRDELNALVEQHSKLLKVTHVLSQAGSGWSGEHGRIRADLVDQLIPKPDTAHPTFICACGPTPFTKLALSLVQDAGHTTLACHAFLA